MLQVQLTLPPPTPRLTAPLPPQGTLLVALDECSCAYLQALYGVEEAAAGGAGCVQVVAEAYGRKEVRGSVLVNLSSNSLPSIP